VTDTGYRLDARLINIVLQVFGASRSATDTHRDTLSRIFSPAAGAVIYLRCTRDDSEVRQIDCYAVGMVDMAAELQARPLATQRVGIQLKAPNPIWYDPTATSVPLTQVAADWYLAGGLIGTADVFTAGTAIAAGSVWPTGEIANDVPYSILIRTVGTASGQMFGYYQPGPAEHYIASSSAGTAGGTVQWNKGGQGAILLPVQAGTHTYIVVSDQNNVRGQVYEDDRILADILFDGSGIENTGGSARWGKSVSNTNAWGGTIPYGAVYRKVLTEAEREVLVAITGNADNFTSAVTTGGSWNEYPVIDLTGPLTNPRITNYTTGEILNLSAGTIPGSVSYTIDCRYGYKTVTDSLVTNRIDELSDDSDLATFHLQPGINIIGVSASGTAAASAVSIRYYDRYLAL
jgi:hypothetical protein